MERLITEARIQEQRQLVADAQRKLDDETRLLDAFIKGSLVAGDESGSSACIR